MSVAIRAWLGVVAILSFSLGALTELANGQAPAGSLAEGNGSIVAWGDNTYGQAQNHYAGKYGYIAAGATHNLSTGDGYISGWGDNTFGQITLPYTQYFIRVAAGQGFSLATGGSLVGWGDNSSGQITVPSGSFWFVAAGQSHGLAIRNDGTLAGWGLNSSGQATVPSGTFSAVAGGFAHSLGLRTDGTLTGWGLNTSGQTNVPGGTFMAIAAGFYHSLGIRSDGTLVSWGDNTYGENSVPTGTYSAVSAGNGFSLGIRSDGTLVGWGRDSNGQTDVPSGTYVQVAAGANHGVAMQAKTIYDDLAIYGDPGVESNLNRSITVTGEMAVGGTVNFYNNPVASVTGRLFLGNTAAFVGSGTIVANGGVSMQSNFALPANFILDSGPLTGSGLLTLGANSHTSIALAPSNLFFGGLTIQSGATLTPTGAGLLKLSTLTNNNGEFRESVGQRVVINGATLNAGKIEVMGSTTQISEIEFLGAATNAASTGLITGHNDTLRFTGGLINGGSILLTSGLNDVSGDIVNNATGTIVVAGGASVTFYDDIVQNGTLEVMKVGATNSIAVFAGAFTGSGGSSGAGDIFFLGDLRPGNSPANVTFNNNVGLGSGASLDIELGGYTLGSQYDHAEINGQLSLDGTLKVSLLSSFMPTPGHSFDILGWSSLVGSFSALNLPTLSSGQWDTSQLYTSGVLSVISVLPGDYDHNGTVDDADYVVWRKGLGTIYTQSDYGVWRAHFGQTAGSGLSASASFAVPEPASALMLLMGLVVMCAHRRAAATFIAIRQ